MGLFLILATLMVVCWYLIVNSIFIYLIANGVESIFGCTYWSLIYIFSCKVPVEILPLIKICLYFY